MVYIIFLLAFFKKNRSKDDPFLLYASFHSGGHCMLVTRDLLRDHRAVLSDSVTRRLFFKWQRGHQMVVSSYVPGKILTFEVLLHIFMLFLFNNYLARVINQRGCSLCKENPNDFFPIKMSSA